MKNLIILTITIFLIFFSFSCKQKGDTYIISDKIYNETPTKTLTPTITYTFTVTLTITFTPTVTPTQ